ncbi:MAG: CRISPR-associated endonuclease Cas1, partial [Dolichospermum sp.]
WLINRKIMDVQGDFEFKNGGCYLNNLGRKKFLRGFLQRMTEEIKTDEGINQFDNFDNGDWDYKQTV